MAAVMGWLARARTRPRAPQEAHTLAHPRSTLVVGLVCAGFFSLHAVWSALFPGKTGSPLISLFFLAFAALGVFAAAALGGVPPAAIDADTLALLEATARGELPRVWG